MSFLHFPEKVLVESDVAVKTKVTTVGKLVPSSDRKAADPLASTSGEDATTVLEGWHKSWGDPHESAMVMPNIKWMKENLEFGLFHLAKPYKNNCVEVVPRKILRDRMEIHQPPLPTSMMGSVPNMMAFFTTRVFFWRPVGVIKVKITCPNTNCPSPETHLIMKGYVSTARQVCGLTSYYTLLTERLLCISCSNLRRLSQSAVHESDNEDEDVGVYK
ncbi:hypothetical protein DPMN_045810 [Dreissena polymorpha]|uniref:DUF6729 domain-containing protein n=1 Tax=Dreissena polymorpha TaxID=45954 RepID=A0A9D4I014_DREPO|nr:hypothetical protein DPMN_045810 [Dreissena polymorpha]